MEALMFNTKILEDGIIQIPELKKWKNNKIQIFIIKDSNIIQQNEPDIENEAIKQYRKLLDKSNNKNILTIETATNINELTNDIS